MAAPDEQLRTCVTLVWSKGWTAEGEKAKAKAS
jgi:hypothetical protein